jgi:hypothetical protein
MSSQDMDRAERDLLAKDSFDLERDVVIEEELPTALVPATDVSVLMDLGPTLNVRATSSGWSLLVRVPCG